MLNMLLNNELNNKRLLHIKNEIEKLDHYFEKTDKLSSKHQIRDKSLFIRLKFKATQSHLPVITNTQNMLISEEINDVYMAIKYIEEHIPENLTNEEYVELYTYKALLYELTDANEKARKTYLKAIKKDESGLAFKEYKEFQHRIEELKNYSKNDYTPNQKYTLDDLLNFDAIIDSAQSIELIAKYYARSEKSLPIAQNYFKQVLEIYKEAASKNPRKYQYQYILSLIKSVETYKMDKEALEEAEVLLFHSNSCEKSEKYLLNKIKRLKESK